MWVKPELMEGSVHRDARGQLAYVNDFGFEGVKRFYTLTHADTAVLRAWQGHRRETKHFYVSQGAFLIGLVQPDDWEQPSADLAVLRYTLTADHPAVLRVPGGYANGFRALEAGSVLTIFSDMDVDASNADLVRFDPYTWSF